MLDAQGRHITPSMQGTSDGRVKRFLCRRAWEFEIGRIESGAEIYPSSNALKDHINCAESCGVIKFRVVFKRYIIHGISWDYRLPPRDEPAPRQDGRTP